LIDGEIITVLAHHVLSWKMMENNFISRIKNKTMPHLEIGIILALVQIRQTEFVTDEPQLVKNIYIASCISCRMLA